MLKLLQNAQLRKKIIFSFGVIVIFRLFAHIPVFGVDITALRAYLQSNALLGIYDLFSGGGFQNFSLATLGLTPYINASIVIQLFTVTIPKLEELSKEGDYGREQLNLYVKLLAIPVSLIQSYGVYFLLHKQGIIQSLSGLDLAVFIASLTGGGMLLVWVGELITQYGVGQGISILIFVGIVSRLPQAFLQVVTNWYTYDFFVLLIAIGLILATIVGVVLVNEGTRNIVLEYGRWGAMQQKVKNYLPIKINQAGVIPIIFALSVVLIPSFLAGPLSVSQHSAFRSIGRFFQFQFTSSSGVYNLVYFFLVIVFTFFYTFVQFNPEKVSENLKKGGGFIPGIRPGKATTDYLSKVVIRLTLFGSSFLGVIAIAPFLIQKLTGFEALTIGGTGILIVVSVVLETVRQVEAHSVKTNYQNYLQ